MTSFSHTMILPVLYTVYNRLLNCPIRGIIKAFSYSGELFLFLQDGSLHPRGALLQVQADLSWGVNFTNNSDPDLR